MHKRKYKLSDVKFAQFKIINHFSITCAYHINFSPNIITKIYVAINMLNELLNNIHNIIVICVKLKRAVILSQSAAETDYNVGIFGSRSPTECLQFRIASASIRQIFDTSHLPTSRSRYSKITLSIPAATRTVEILSFVVDGGIEGERGWGEERLPRQ